MHNSTTYTLQPTVQSDIPEIMTIVNEAQACFKNAGIEQWQNGYPNEAVFLNDIRNGHSFVVRDGNRLIATIMISFDGEPTYREIAGEWVTAGPYAVLHRLAVPVALKGNNIAGIILEQVEELCKHRGIGSIRIDTHEQNKAMQRVAEKSGFHYCGVITLSDGSPRLAYEKKL